MISQSIVVAKFINQYSHGQIIINNKKITFEVNPCLNNSKIHCHFLSTKNQL